MKYYVSKQKHSMEKLYSMYFQVKMWWLNYCFQYICRIGNLYAVVYVPEIFPWKPKSQLPQIHTDVLAIVKMTLRNIHLHKF